MQELILIIQMINLQKKFDFYETLFKGQNKIGLQLRRPILF